MGRRQTRCVSLWWLAIVVALFAVPASAQTDKTHQSCHAYSDEATGIGDAASLSWICTDSAWRYNPSIVWLRFESWDRQSLPRYFTSRITTFDRITIAAVDADGTIRQRDFTMDDAEPILAGAVFSLPLPSANAKTRSYLVRIQYPHSVTVASEARLQHQKRAPDQTTASLILIALMAGMLIIPLIFDIGFYFAEKERERERFVMIHGAMVAWILAYLFFAGGLLTAFVSAPLWLLAIGAPVAWAMAVALAAFFTDAFLEPHLLPRPLSIALRASGWWTIFVPGICALQLSATQSFDNILYFMAFIPVIITFTFACIWTLLHGSVAARFLSAAWAPIIIMGTDRLLRGIGTYSAGTSIDLGLFAALSLEVLIFTTGVVHRFINLGRERETAITEARMLEEISERDVLTGLLNRRALQERFATLRSSGFANIALFDLDHFKSINDQFGHQIGDQVLRAAASALVVDHDAKAFRIGGEEFLLMLRGNEPRERVERAREAISLRVASDVPGLDRMVTSSAGMLEMGQDAMPDATFEELYIRIDRLLYEAKDRGRNCMISEKLRVFHRRRRGDRRKKAA